RQKWVLSVGLLSASPARIPKDIDVRCPERQAEKLLTLVLAHRLVVFGAGFGRDSLAHAMHQRRIPGGPHPNHLWKLRRVTGKRDTMQTFVPPIVLRDTQSWDSGRMVA